MMISVIRTGLAGRSVPGLAGNFSKASNTSSPPTRFPNTVCFLSRWGVGLNVMNHWDLMNQPPKRDNQAIVRHRYGEMDM